MGNKTNGDDPVGIIGSDSGHIGASGLGLTKREYFAAMAMQGILASDWGKKRDGEGKSDIMLDQVRMAAVKCADAIINELNKEGV